MLLVDIYAYTQHVDGRWRTHAVSEKRSPTAIMWNQQAVKSTDQRLLKYLVASSHALVRAAHERHIGSALQLIVDSRRGDLTLKTL